jgi:hypothetical protein
MPDLDNDQSHWQQLAKQLGLPPEPAEQTYAPPSPPVRQEAKPFREETPLPEPVPASASEDITEDAVAPRIEEMPADAESAPPAEEKRRPARGRRRGRRGGRRTEDIALPAAEHEAPGESERPERAAVEAGEEESPPDRSRRRGRGRPRRKKETADVVESTDALDADTVPSDRPPEPDDESGDDAGEDMSGWTIPSWQELIDSLYRPDR